MIGRGRLQPQPTSPPPLAAWDSSAWRAKAAIQRARAAAAAPSIRSSRAAGRRRRDGPTDRRSKPQHPGRVGDGGWREGRWAYSPRAGTSISRLVSLRGAQKGGDSGAPRGRVAGDAMGGWFGVVGGYLGEIGA